MRSTVRRAVLGTAFLFGGILMVTLTSVAADVPEDVLKTVMETDIKRVNDLVEKYNAMADKKSPIQIRSTSMMVAAYAQSKIAGKDEKEDKKYAGLRDQALKVFEAALPGKDMKKATPLDLAKASDGDPKIVALHKAAKFDINDLMAQFKKTTANGLNLEQDIKDAANKGAKVDSAGIAARVSFVGDFLKDVGPDGGFDAKKTKKSWDDSTEKMMAANKDLMAATKDKSAPKIKEALKKMDGACTACHNVFK
jgi:hypothetical protein